jgi:hypothetical protein
VWSLEVSGESEELLKSGASVSFSECFGIYFSLTSEVTGRRVILIHYFNVLIGDTSAQFFLSAKQNVPAWRSAQETANVAALSGY